MTKKPVRESVFAKRVWKELDKIPNSYFFSTQQKSIHGTPDILGVINGWFIALELKRSKAEANKKSGRIVLQKYVICKLNEAGAEGFFVYPENLDWIIERLTEISRNGQI